MDRRTVVARIGAFIVSGVLLLSVIMWLPGISMAVPTQTSTYPYGRGTTSVQETPTADPTTTALEKEKLKGDVAQQQHTWENWFWSNGATILSSFLSALVLAIAGLFGLWRWRRDRHTEREKQAEERFHSVVESLGGERVETKIGGAVVLRTFLQPGYEQFYRQIFDLAVSNLRLQPHPSSDNQPLPTSVRKALTALLSPTHLHNDLEPQLPLNQVLTTVFKESFPKIRDRLKQDQIRDRLKQGLPLKPFSLKWILVHLRRQQRQSLFESQLLDEPQLLDATAVRLDKAHLQKADLKEIWMPEAHLESADLTSAFLSHANLSKTNFTKAHLESADLTNTNLIDAIFTDAFLDGTEFPDARLENAKFDRADLKGANFTKAVIRRCTFTEANLTEADFTGAIFSETNLLDAKFLLGAHIHNVEGLTSDQLEACQREKRASVIPQPQNPNPLPPLNSNKSVKT